MEEKSSLLQVPPRRSNYANQHNAASAQLASIEARLAGQMQQNGAVTTNGTNGQANPAVASSSSSSLPSSSGHTNLLRTTTHASLLNNSAPSSSLPPLSSLDLNPLDWSEMQFKRAGVQPSSHAAAAVTSTSAGIPIHTLGFQQRMRHAQLFSSVDKLREGQQHIFLSQFNQFPNVESHTADDYSKIWHAFKRKDDEAEEIISRLNEVAENMDALNRHTSNSHS